MQSFFIWHGIDSRSMGVITKRHAPLIRPEERVNHVTIPGRSGDLTETEGQYIFNSYIQTVSFSVADGSRVPGVFGWLRGSDYVTFSSEPDKMQEARVIGAITLEKVSRNMDRWAGQAQFYCQPLKRRIYDPVETLTAAGSIRNNGDVKAYPIITATPNDGATSMEITVNGKTLAISGVTGALRIDCAAREISNADRTAILTKNSAGPFPVLDIGSNTVGGSGWASLAVNLQERFL